MMMTSMASELPRQHAHGLKVLHFPIMQVAFIMGVGDKVKAVAEKVTGGASSPAAGPSPDEQRLLDTSKTFDTAVSQRDTASLKSLLAPTVRVHQDGLSLKEDLSGCNAVSGWFQSYFDRCARGQVACCVGVC